MDSAIITEQLLLGYGLTELEAFNTINRFDNNILKYAVSHCLYKNKDCLRAQIKLALLFVKTCNMDNDKV